MAIRITIEGEGLEELTTAARGFFERISTTLAPFVGPAAARPDPTDADQPGGANHPATTAPPPPPAADFPEGAPKSGGVAAGIKALHDASPSTKPLPELDVNGLPWDARIHTGTKTKNTAGAKLGTWRQKRGTTAPTLDAVVAELRARPDVIAAVAANPPAPPSTSAGPPPPPPGSAPAEGPTGELQPIIEAANECLAFADRFTGEEKVAEVEALTVRASAICQKHGLVDIGELSKASSAPLWPSVLEDFVELKEWLAIAYQCLDFAEKYPEPTRTEHMEAIRVQLAGAVTIDEVDAVHTKLLAHYAGE